MVESTCDIMQQYLVLSNLSEFEQRPDDTIMVQPAISTIRVLHKAFFKDYFLYLSRMRNPQDESKGKKDELNVLFERLNHPMEDKNLMKAQEAETLNA